MTKRPAFQFYPSDWRNDAGLRLCSIGARGLWMDMMCLMHDGDPYGHLTVMGRPITPDQLARLVGEAAPPTKRWLAELRENEVFSETEEGVIFSRRMVRDEDVRNRRGAGGEAGAEHGHKGASHGRKGGRPRKENPPLDENLRGVSKPAPSSSSSSPPSSSEQVSEANASGAEAPKPAPTDLVKAVFDGGVRLLTDSGHAEKQARSLVGKWRQRCGDAELLTLLAEAQSKSEPLEWLTAAVETRNGNRNRNGYQPSAALAMWREANAEIEAERRDAQGDLGDWTALPAH